MAILRTDVPGSQYTDFSSREEEWSGKQTREVEGNARELTCREDSHENRMKPFISPFQGQPEALYTRNEQYKLATVQRCVSVLYSKRYMVTIQKGLFPRRRRRLARVFLVANVAACGDEKS